MSTFETKHPGLKKEFLIESKKSSRPNYEDVMDKKGNIHRIEKKSDPHTFEVKSYVNTRSDHLYSEESIDASQIDKQIVREAINKHFGLPYFNKVASGDEFAIALENLMRELGLDK